MKVKQVKRNLFNTQLLPSVFVLKVDASALDILEAIGHSLARYLSLISRTYFLLFILDINTNLYELKEKSASQTEICKKLYVIWSMFGDRRQFLCVEQLLRNVTVYLFDTDL